jgi:hypothetical protein
LSLRNTPNKVEGALRKIAGTDDLHIWPFRHDKDFLPGTKTGTEGTFADDLVNHINECFF